MNIQFDSNDIKIYKSDNIELLKSLPDNSVNLIYCDILYNSGKKFDDYDDDLGTPHEAIEWYRPRIKEMHRVLSKNGTILIHCNWRIDSYIRVLLDEIFGFYNFRNRIYRKHSETRGFVNNVDSQVDVILYYVKNRHDFVFNEILGDKLNIFPLFENGTSEERSYNFNYKDITFNPLEHGKHWLIPIHELKKLCDKDEVVFIDGYPYRKTYAIPIGNLWDEECMLDSFSRTDIEEGYDTPKPLKALERIIRMFSNPGDTVADFFMGGGTTVIETFKNGRKGIFCDISEKACKVTIKKLINEINKLIVKENKDE